MSDTVVCPYCRMPFDEPEPPKIFCTACGVPHHEDCYQENGGCTVFGCARAPADDPKLHVSQNDLNAVATSQMASPVQQQPLTPASPAPSYGLEGRPSKSRTTFIVLGVFLGPFGAHNFY